MLAGQHDRNVTGAWRRQLAAPGRCDDRSRMSALRRHERAAPLLETARHRGWTLGWRKLESEGVGHFRMFSTREALQSLQ